MAVDLLVGEVRCPCGMGFRLCNAVQQGFHNILHLQSTRSGRPSKSLHLELYFGGMEVLQLCSSLAPRHNTGRGLVHTQAGAHTSLRR